MEMTIKRYCIGGKTRVLGYEEHRNGKVFRRYCTPSGKYVTVDEWPEDENWAPDVEVRNGQS